MKKVLKTLTLTLMLAFSVNSLYAHGSAGHTHAKKELSEVKVEGIAKAEVKRLAQANKISKTWLRAPQVSIRTKTFGSSDEWIVSYKNKLINDKSKQKLYIFITTEGKVSGANYTGN